MILWRILPYLRTIRMYKGGRHMKRWKDHKIQLLLMLFAISEVFAYFYPGYANDIPFALLQMTLAITIIWMLIMEDNHETHRRLH